MHKLQIVKVQAFQTEKKEPEPCYASHCNIFVKLESYEVNCSLIMEIDTGPEVSIIHYDQLPSELS